MYKTVYGATRRERAHRLATNQPPYYTQAPRQGTYTIANPAALFTQQYRYVEDVRDGKQRDYIVVRSQKFCKSFRKYYTITIPQGLDVIRTGIFNYRSWSCNCKDNHKCKHILAIVEKYRTKLRF